jgi:lysine 6-dehydrogenase
VRAVVLGAGRQGLAIAWDLAVRGGAREVVLVEADRGVLREGAARLRRLVPGFRFRAVPGAVGGGREDARLLRGADVAVSAVPYRFNPGLARAAVAARVPFCDLGGNTDLVLEALELDRAARRAGVGIVPDCGLAPGLGNVLAAMLVDEVPGIRHVRIRCGGLPRVPRGPLGYALLFSVGGLTNEYTGEAVVLRGGRLRRFEAFTEPEPFDGPGGLGRLECFFTSGGTSTAPWTFRGRLETYEYKTVRYPGHYDRVRAMIELGLLDLAPVEVPGGRVVPRDLFHAVAGPRLDAGTVEDLAILRVDGTGPRGRGVRYSMLQRFDRRTGFSAMEQTTGFPAAATAADLAFRRLPPGARTPERLGYGPAHLRDLRRRGLRIRRGRSSLST